MTIARIAIPFVALLMTQTLFQRSVSAAGGGDGCAQGAFGGAEGEGYSGTPAKRVNPFDLPSPTGSHLRKFDPPAKGGPQYFEPAVEAVYVDFLSHLKLNPAEFAEFNSILLSLSQADHLSIDQLQKGFNEFVRNQPSSRNALKAKHLPILMPLYRRQLAVDLFWILMGGELVHPEGKESFMAEAGMQVAHRQLQMRIRLYDTADPEDPAGSAFMQWPKGPAVGVWVRRFENMRYRFRNYESSLLRLNGLIETYMRLAKAAGYRSSGYDRPPSLWIRHLIWKDSLKSARPPLESPPKDE